jgi:flagellar basal body-associated protein FliL
MSAVAIAEPTTEGAEAAPRRRGHKLLLAVLAVVLLAGVGGGWWYLGPAEADEAPVESDGAIVPVPPMTTTVGESHLHHARVGLGVVLTQDADPEALEPRIPLLQDALLREMATMSAYELRGAEGSAALRARLGDEARAIWGEDVVRRVILTELLVQ